MPRPDPVSLLQSVVPDYYQVLQPVKAGGQGGVFLAERSGTRVALKVFGPQTEPCRTDREIELLAELDCPHIVRIVDHFAVTVEGNSYPLVVYEFHEGGDLTSLLGGGATTATVGQVLKIGRQVGIAIEELWARRVVHRDIKPDNVVIADEERYVVVDLGFARHLDLASVTVGGNPGTVGYMSPEQAAGRRHLTVHSDVFSLGLTLFEVAAGFHPYGRDQRRIGSEPQPSLFEHRRDFPAPVCALIERTMATSAAERPVQVSRAFEELMEDL